MTARLTIEWEGGQGFLHEIPVVVSLDRDGDLWAECLEAVPCRVLSGHRDTYDEWLETGAMEFRPGDPIELSPEDEAEAHRALQRAATLAREEVAELRGLFAPRT